MKKGIPINWLNWLTDGPTTDAAEMLRLVDLIEGRFRAFTETRIAKRRVEYASKQMNLYRSIPSVLKSELDSKQVTLDIERADYIEALETRELASLKLQQWVHRNHRRFKEKTIPSEETLIKVVRAGRKVNRAKAEVARIMSEANSKTRE